WQRCSQAQPQISHLNKNRIQQINCLPLLLCTTINPCFFKWGFFADLQAAHTRNIFPKRVTPNQPSTHHQIAPGGKSDKIMAKPLRPNGSPAESGREELLPELRPAHAPNA
ncbi:MAG: hypothetical protein ACK5W5_00405, partial [Cyanobacteriota bacterium]